ncbi:hypothetical protein A3781_19510 [Bacillus badius]|nr:hypothetical protein A3781_19510 [Bacillus badius]
MKKVISYLLYMSLFLGLLAIFFRGVWLFIIWPISIIIWTLMMTIKERNTKKSYVWLSFLVITIIVFSYGLVMERA